MRCFLKVFLNIIILPKYSIKSKKIINIKPFKLCLKGDWGTLNMLINNCFTPLRYVNDYNLKDIFLLLYLIVPNTDDFILPSL